MLNPWWTVVEFSRKLLQQFQHLRQTLTTLTTHSWLTLTPLYPTHFPSWGNVSHTCAKVQHGRALLSNVWLQFLEFLELTTKQLNNHWLRSFECLPWDTLARQQKHSKACDNKHLKTATVNAFTQIWHLLFVFFPLSKYWVFSLKFPSDRRKHL